MTAVDVLTDFLSKEYNVEITDTGRTDLPIIMTISQKRNTWRDADIIIYEDYIVIYKISKKYTLKMADPDFFIHLQNTLDSVFEMMRGGPADVV